MRLRDHSVVVGVSLLVMLGFWILPHIPQPNSYHQFADQRVIWGIPHFGDVVSGIPFMLLGVWGICQCQKRRHKIVFLSSSHRWAYLIFFFSLVAEGAGSLYYHWSPNNLSLFWDRLPLGVAMMSILVAMVIERVDPHLGSWLLVPFLILGVASVCYWELSELNGDGDLRLYGFVQILPAVLIPILFLIYPARYTGTGYLVHGFIWLTLARLNECFDEEVYYSLGELVSGHTLKHICASITIYMVVLYLKKRSLLTTLPEAHTHLGRSKRSLTRRSLLNDEHVEH